MSEGVKALATMAEAAMRARLGDRYDELYDGDGNRRPTKRRWGG